ncbi:type 2 isopentenyl-diphosphate Delta-isomerase [Candidatus Cyanaurora vandensis]|uniref:type 2 isopentenyl-diphosphate Delta-isomerase n=1 Tax=Candidatus Cyanaurora vandensis TaxID=2714958 RepID=UPI00257A668D|nr:type 2 isopentenyl-diphosphate Delta-isomerase [Candidatus Cyanaurora vandensis]
MHTERKQAHLDIVLQENVQAKGVTTGFERYFFDHVALPELHLDQIDLGLTLWGRTLKAPFLISSMTGGTESARAINLHLAEAAQALGVAMGVGSQRAALAAGQLSDTYQVRRVAPDILLFANFGAVQLNEGYGLREAERAVGMIEADALILHLNPLQEAVQPGGDCDWRGLYGRIEQLVRQLPVPVIVKEVGNGIGVGVARRLVECGVSAVDVAGAGGTSWSEVEAHRQSDPLRKRVAHAFAGWGLPTALAVETVCQALPGFPVFASGGIQDGVEAGKALALGAVLVGSAAPLLGPATVTAAAVYEKFRAYQEELRVVCFCTGSQDLASLRRATLRRVANWEVLRGSE